MNALKYTVVVEYCNLQGFRPATNALKLNCEECVNELNAELD